ncbi:MAG: hypothetical protein NT066_07055, partial [Candidatus Omnitrophica bacterium]|nr:hypothetical protein [Candidatus Omnitrophota bacterium]
MLRKILSLVLSFMLFFSQAGIAAVAPELNIAAYLGKFNYSPPDKLRLPLLRYFSYDNLNNNFKLILDKGDFKEIKGPELKDSSRKLLSYFLIGITLPNESFWVNLRPDSSDNIIDDYLAQTDVGKILLEADLQLKKDTARFTSPQTPEGKLYWDKLYQKAGELFGSENITIPTLTRPWIVPGEVIIRESQDSAYVYKASLKVMLEQDHLKGSANYNFTDPRLKALNEYSSQLIREFILPKLTKEVNISKRYAQLRQVYYSLVLSRWFKARFYGKGGIYASAIDKKNLNGLLSQGNWSKNTYFKEYQKSFQQGEYNLKAQAAGISGQNIRSYFSGGIALGGKELDIASSPIVGGFVGNKALDFAGRLPGVHLFGNPDLNNLLPDRLSSSPAGSNDRFNALQDRVRLMEIDRRLGDLAPKIARSDERMQGIRISVHMSSFSEERYRESRALRGEKFDLEQEKAQIKERQRRGGSSPAASPVVNEVDLSNIIPIVTINTANPVTLNGSIDLDSIGDGLVLYEVRKAEGDKTFGVPHIKITRSGQTIRIYGADDSEIEPIGINEWNCELHSSHQLRFVRIGNELRLILNNMIPATEKVYALYRIRDSVASSPVQAGAATSSPVRVADVLRANLDKSISLADLMKQTGLLQAQLAIILPYFMYGGYGGENFELKVSPEAGLISVAQGGYSMTELYNQRITTPAGVEALRALIKTKILAIWVPSAASPSTSSGLVVSESATGGRVEPTSSPAKVAFKEAKAREWLRSQGLSFLSPTFL